MAKGQGGSSGTSEENRAYALLIFFFFVLLVKGTFGKVSGSETLLATSLLSLLGVACAVAALSKLAATAPAASRKTSFSYGRLEFLSVACISLAVAIGSLAVLLFIGHLAFYHTIFPPGLTGAWVATGTAVANLCFARSIKRDLNLATEIDTDAVVVLLNIDFVMSILVIVTVILSRWAIPLTDYVVGILMAVFVVAYSIRFIRGSLGGLLDASCHHSLILTITSIIHRAEAGLDLKELRATHVGRMHEIAVIIRLPKQARLAAAKKLAAKIREALAVNLTVPHDLHIGFTGEDS